MHCCTGELAVLGRARAAACQLHAMADAVARILTNLEAAIGKETNDSCFSCLSCVVLLPEIWGLIQACAYTVIDVCSHHSIAYPFCDGSLQQYGCCGAGVKASTPEFRVAAGTLVRTAYASEQAHPSEIRVAAGMLKLVLRVVYARGTSDTGHSRMHSWSDACMRQIQTHCLHKQPYKLQDRTKSLHPSVNTCYCKGALMMLQMQQSARSIWSV